MYPGYGENQYWVGELDANNRISGFYSLTLNPNLASLTRDDMLYYVAIEEDGDDIQVQCIQQYMAWAKQEARHHSITDMIENSIIDIVEAANSILAKHEQIVRRPN